MDKICAIISGGDFAPLNDIEDANFIIVCDKGYEYAKREGINPDLFIGDLDSFKGDIPKDLPSVILPCEKDETDTMAAIKYAVKNGFDRILLFCALGGRLDHLLGNLQSAAYAAKSGLPVKIYDFENEIFVFSNSKITIPKRSGFSISIISLTDTCEGVSILGGKYPLNKTVLENTSTLGISNEWADDITVTAESGVLAVVMSKINQER